LYYGQNLGIEGYFILRRGQEDLVQTSLERTR
jgi:hypothetical protein